MQPAALCLAACSSLPGTGPRSAQVQEQYQPDASNHPFQLVDINATAIQVLQQRPDTALMSRFSDTAAPATVPDLAIGRGDGVTVTIWEVGADTLFSAGAAANLPLPTVNSARGAVIPEQVVASDGSITIPFAGRIEAAGHTPLQVQQSVEQALTGKAQKPQVLVNVNHNASNTVTVVGEVTNGARVPLTNYGERLLDVLAAAGGIRAPTYETQVQLTRGDSSVTLPLTQVLRDPRENIRMRAGDDLIVTRQPETFTALGATGHNAQINFDAARVSLGEAVAKAGGLVDTRADPRGVFLFRHEPRAVAESLGPVPEGLAGVDSVPVVYRLDLSQAGGFFLAQNFDMRDHDMLYVANASSTELEKFLFLVGLVAQPIISGAAVEGAVR